MGIIGAIHIALEQDGHLLSAVEKEAISQHIKALETALAGEQSRAIHDATAALNTATEAFAAKRMDESVSPRIGGEKY